MDHFVGFRRLRADPEGLTKLGVGSLLLLSAMLVPFVGQIALRGWTALMVRRTTMEPEAPLPRLDLDLDYIGKLFGTGFKGFLISMLWSLPIALVLAPGIICLVFGAVFAMSQSGDDPKALLCLFGAGVPVLVVLGLLLALPAQIAGMRAEIADDFGPGLKFGEVLHATRLVFREALTATLVLGVVQAVLLPLSMLLCYLPLFPVAVAMMVAHAHVAGQLHRLSIERGAVPVAIGPTDFPKPGQPALPG